MSNQSTNLQQQADEIAQQLEQEQQAQQNQSINWSTGLDVVELGSEFISAIADLFSGIDLDF